MSGAASTETGLPLRRIEAMASSAVRVVNREGGAGPALSRISPGIVGSQPARRWCPLPDPATLCHEVLGLPLFPVIPVRTLPLFLLLASPSTAQTGRADPQVLDSIAGAAVAQNRAVGMVVAVVRRAPVISYTWVFAPGAICSTVGDLVTWLKALHGGKVMSAASYTEMISPAKLTDGSATNYAMGVKVGEDYRGIRYIGHGGTAPGFRADATWFPDAKDPAPFIGTCKLVAGATPLGVWPDLLRQRSGHPDLSEVRRFHRADHRTAKR